MSATGKGTGMHLDSSWVRFVRSSKRGPSSGLGDNLVEIRRMLQTDMSIKAIAESFGVSLPTMRSFIKQRQLCRDMRGRNDFIRLQRSLAKLDKETA